ncbi:MAG TPA: APC family permease [Steroidobacteraceae bacterium]|nr:APC family permease [Steroidobacteraceae bacterium]
MTTTSARPLRRILGMGFGLALVFGTMVGVGILRLPGTVAAALGDRTLIMIAWGLGGLYSLMGAVSVAELAAMIPETGGFRVYARRAFGEGIGFAVAWVDWLTSVAALAYVAVTAAAFLAVLYPPATAFPRVDAILILALFTGIHWLGLRIGSSLTAIISTAIGLMLMILVMACLLASPIPASVAPPIAKSAASLPMMSIAMVLALVPALRAVLTAYDGWYQPIYMAEENTDPARTLPRAIIGGTSLVVALYLLINIAFLHVLSVPVLAASQLPAADAARVVLPRGGAELVTVISLLTVLSLLNNLLLAAPRILFAIGRDGLLTDKAAIVSEGGTPRLSLTLTSAVVALVILTGSFEQIIALSAVLFLIYYSSAFLAVFVLRYRLPNLPRPYKALGYPVSTAIVLIGSIAFLIAAVAEDPRSGLIAAVFLACCAPVYAWVARSRRLRVSMLAS